MRSSKSTWWPSKSGPSTQANLIVLADLDPAPAAHSGAVDHHRVQAHHRADAVRAGRLGASLHHDRRADGDDLLDVGVPGDRLPDALGDEALDARRAVVGADDQLVAAGAELVFPEDRGTCCESRGRRSRRRRSRDTRAPAGRSARRPGRRRRRPPSSPSRCGSGCPSGRRPRAAGCRRGSSAASRAWSCRPPG